MTPNSTPMEGMSHLNESAARPKRAASKPRLTTHILATTVFNKSYHFLYFGAVSNEGYAPMS